MSKPVCSRCGAIFFGLIFLAVAATAHAQGILFPRPDVTTQPFYVKNLRVNAVITDAVAETSVEQTFVNTSSVEQEGTYLYPLPEGATPTSFSLTVGDRTLEPRILTHDEARSVYENIVRRRRDPALLEYVGRDLLRVSIFPIPPQGERIIRMRYTETLKPEGGLRKYAYALSTSRFGGRTVGTASVTVKLHTTASIKNVYSPTHDVSVRRAGDHDATASWEGDNVASDRDLALYFSVGGEDVGLSMLTYKTGDHDGYFLLLAAPRVAIPASRILPKQIVFVLDRTGSMNGAKIEQARKSLLFCLNNLHPQDRFDVITFNESPDVLMPRLQAATEANVAKARRFVQDIEASGGTNIDDALRAALTLLKNEQGGQKMVVFLTDGLPTVGETDINTILHHVRDLNGGKQAANDEPGARARLFCFGLGYDVNVPFLDRLADLGRGDADYVKPEEDIEVKVSAFFAKVTSPILSDLRLAFDGADVYDVYPKTLPDLFKGSQLVIAGRYRGAGEGIVRLAGSANGDHEAFQLPMRPAETDAQNVFLPRLWAARKIGWLVDQIRLSENPAGKQELADEIVRLSREYGIITEYTSFLVDERELPAIGLNYRIRGLSAHPGQFSDGAEGHGGGGQNGFGGSGGLGGGQGGGAIGGAPGGSGAGNTLGGNLAQGGSGIASGLLRGTGINPSDLYGYDADNSVIYAPGGLNVGSGVVGYDADNSVIVAMGKEVLRRVAQGGSTGQTATDQSLLAQSLRKSNQFASRYQGSAGHDLALNDQGTMAGRSSVMQGITRQLSGGGFPGSNRMSGQSEQGASLASAPAVTMQAVADRSFVVRNGVWVDTTFDPKKQSLVKIKAFSDAHFALIKAIPNLAAYSSVGDAVIVRLGKKAVLLGKTGQEQLTDADLKELTAK